MAGGAGGGVYFVHLFDFLSVIRFIRPIGSMADKEAIAWWQENRREEPTGSLYFEYPSIFSVLSEISAR